MEHELKTWPQYYEAVADGRKTFELRQDDRGFAVGDILRLNEFDPKTQLYSGRTTEVLVTYKVDGGQFGLLPGYCVLGFKVP